MLLNILGNRSYRDISQYPVFPWVITDYETAIKKPEKEEIKSKIIEEMKNKLIEKCIRDFHTPIGLIELSNKGIKRKYSYLNTYISAIQSLLDEYQILNKYPKIKELCDKIEKIIDEYDKENIIGNNDNNINEEISPSNSTKFSEIIKSIENYKIPKLKNQNNSILSQFKFDVDFINLFKEESKKKIKK